MRAPAPRKNSPPCLLRDPSETARARLFCFPYSGGGASMFSSWPHQVDDVEICPVQLPARENRFREPHFGTYEELAQALVDPLLPYLDRPFAFFGHCAGALPAFEVARRLHQEGLPAPRALIVSAQVAPHDCPFDRYLGLGDDQLIEELAALTRSRGGEPHPLVLGMMLDVLRQDLESNRVYRRAEPVILPSRVVVLHWAADAEIRPEQMHGWSAYGDQVSYEVLDGGHFAFLDAPDPLLTLVTELLRPE
ncbi:thioesterase domain-containing protein [Actinoplanes sp. NPDC051470]|uniref:thioesterase II family protein n=1 Tax=unclassified Actinoplanes TaxID=2626549 RepID=UPI00342F681E